jgi:peptidoglycan/xylan/chitin deacetylase (PgdA/CDA1 family)
VEAAGSEIGSVGTASSEIGSLKAASLLYHDVVEPGRFETSGCQGAGPDRYKLDRSEFDDHLRALSDQIDHPPAAAPELGNGGFPVQWLLTFDDGGASARLIGETLAERGWRGHFFVTTDFIGTTGFVTADDIRALDSAGHVIGSHSSSHPHRMAACSWAELLDEWQRSTAALGDIVGRPVSVASIPGGEYGETVARAAAAAQIEHLFTSEPVLTVKQVESCSVWGRLSIVRGDPARRAAELALGKIGPRGRMFASWQAKKAVKTIGGERYLRLRRYVLEKRR